MSLSTSSSSSSDLVASLRACYPELGISGFIVGSGDAHQSEYVAEIDCRREFVSKFTGSAGTALVTSDAAMLWTDGRYFLQASQELSADWTLMKSGLPGVLEMDQWIVENVPAGSCIGVDAFLISASQAKSLSKKLKDERNITLKAVEYNPIDRLWTAAGTRPAAPCNPVVSHSVKYAGRDYNSKIAEVKEFLVSKKAHAIVFTMLDEICWLFNIRGGDVEFNPVVISYAVVTLEKAHFFVDPRKLESLDGSYFDSSVVEVHNYSEIESFLSNMRASNNLVLVDAAQINWQLYLSLGTSLHEVTSPVTLKKSLKNEAEIAGIRQAHIRDGAALTAFLHWLETHVKANPNTFSECDVVNKLEEFRKKMAHHVSPSFSTISGYGPNGAIIHYKPSPDSCAKLGTDSLFLLDSGAQYLDGTTDVTRTIHFGEVPQRMKDCFTLVLRGHINLARAIFPEGTTGHRLDSLARLPLWTAGLDYNHGTGHGVGAFLNVHEGPQGIGSRPRGTVGEGFQAGMTTSNEPGYYEDGHFGIRVENVCVTVEANTENKFGNKKYLRFDDCTVVPIKTSLINIDLMDAQDIKWLNDYHDKVRALIEPVMRENFPESVSYLHFETRHISKQ